MNFRDVIATDDKEDLVFFQGKGCDLITYKGSSDLQITGGKEPSESFVVSGLRKDCENLLVVMVNLHNEKRRPSGNISFILEINCYMHQEEDCTVVKQWKPSIVDRIATVDKNGNIEMRIGDNVFSTNPRRQDVSYYINNPNTCINYLAGRIGAEDVMAAAKETQKQISLQERCDELERINQELSEKITSSEKLVRGFVATLKQLQNDHEYQLKNLRDEIARQINIIATQLRDAVKSPWLTIIRPSRMGSNTQLITRGQKIKKALELFPDNEK